MILGLFEGHGGGHFSPNFTCFPTCFFVLASGFFGVRYYTVVKAYSTCVQFLYHNFHDLATQSVTTHSLIASTTNSSTSKRQNKASLYNPSGQITRNWLLSSACKAVAVIKSSYTCSVATTVGSKISKDGQQKFACELNRAWKWGHDCQCTQLPKPAKWPSTKQKRLHTIAYRQ